MKLFGMELNKRMALWLGMHGLIIIDIILITIAMIFSVPPNVAMDIQDFDFLVCVILLTEWSINFYKSSPKTTFLKQRDNIISFIASIPFDVILPAIIPGVGLLRYLRLLKLFRLIVLFDKLSQDVAKFLDKTNLDKIFSAIIFIVVFFTLILYFFGPSYGLLDDFYFVIVTLTTVGYGDITPQTYNEKIISIILIIIGIFVFSTITAAISSFLTERLLEEDELDIKTDIEETIGEKLDPLEKKLDNLQEENKMLRDEIRQLREMIKEK